MNDICQQRKRQMLFTIPPTRYTPNSPYVQFPQFTQKQLDMRRKAEILSYNATKTNTKTNNLTKKQKWVQLVNGAHQTSSYTTLIQRNSTPYTYIDTSGVFHTNTFQQLFNIVKPTYDCSFNNDLIPTPTSSSGIPGPIQYLVRDTSVPLYNYATNTDNYSILQSENNLLWNLYTSADISFSVATPALYGTLVIRPSIDQYAYAFTIQTPLSLFLNGTTTLSANQTITGQSLRLQSVSLQVYYNKTSVALQSLPVFRFNANSLSTTTNSGSQYTAAFSNNSAFMNYDISGGAPYSIRNFIGMLTVSNIYLYTEHGFIYDFFLTFSMSSPSYLGSTIQYGVIANVSTNASKFIGVANVSTNSLGGFTKNSFSGT